jgi:hypothetical protein
MSTEAIFDLLLAVLTEECDVSGDYRYSDGVAANGREERGNMRRCGRGGCGEMASLRRLVVSCSEVVCIMDLYRLVTCGEQERAEER